MYLLRILLMVLLIGSIYSQEIWDNIGISGSSVEKSGDIIQILLPVTGLGMTYYLDDKIGRKYFWTSFLSSLSLTFFLKYTINRERPNGHDYSFPSGHTTAAFSGATFINNRYGLTYGIPSFLLASFVGYSRVYSENHHWGDVFAGASIGILSNFIFTKKAKKTNKKNIISIGYQPNYNRIIFNVYRK